MCSYKVFIAGLALMILAGCGESKPQVGEESKFLFSRKITESLGDNVGTVALKQDGILIHPGATTPTSVTFGLDGKYSSIVLKPFISKLDAEGEKHADAGIVGVEILVGGKSIEKFSVDRNSNLEKTLDIKGAKSLEIRVNNGNGTPAWDWFTVKVSSIK
jgi:hypothetical protein